MGQSQSQSWYKTTSLQTQSDLLQTDLGGAEAGTGAETEAESEVTASEIIVTLTPVYMIGFGTASEIEANLSTGSDALDALVVDRLGKIAIQLIIDELVQLGQLDQKQFPYNIVYEGFSDGKYCMSLQTCSGQPFTKNDCSIIRKFFYLWTLEGKSRPVIISADEARQSLYFDDLGAIRLGLLILDPIECI